MTEQNAVAADELRSFCKQLVLHSQLKLTRSFQTGSYIEIRDSDRSMKAFGLALDTMDVDVMSYKVDCYAFPCGQRVPAEYNGVVLRILSECMHPGYVRLVEEKSGEELKHNRAALQNLSTCKFSAAHGPAKLYYRSAEFISECADENILIGLQSVVPLMDSIYAVHCPYWPVEASEWITRTRRHGCPSKSVIKQVVRYGCDMVGIAHKLSRNIEKQNEWRFSFSSAELLIIRSWTHNQRIVYRVLKLISKRIQQDIVHKGSETVLCNYYFKTLMLWACEERPMEFWDEHSLVNSIRQLLIEMAEWLGAKFCCNYFIPANNMMDHLLDTDVSKNVVALYEVSAFNYLFTNAISLCSYDENSRIGAHIKAELPAWIYRSLIIFDHINCEMDNYNNLRVNQLMPSRQQNSGELQSALCQELGDIYRGLACLRRESCSFSTACCSSRLRYRQAEECFIAAARLYISTERTFASLNASNSRGVCNLIHSLFARFEADYKASHHSIGLLAADIMKNELVQNRGSHESTNVESFKKALLYSRASEPVSQARYRHRLTAKADKEMSPWTRICSLAVYTTDPSEPTSDTRVDFYREWPCRSPSVNASWFIAKAYLANLYYIQRHYKAAVEMCREVLDVYEYSIGNKCFSEWTFPILLSTQWAAVYDMELQALLGFCLFCAFILDRTDPRSLSLAVCPVQFILYLKLRCMVDQGLLDGSKRYSNEFTEYIEHEQQCIFDHADIGKKLLLKAVFNCMSKDMHRTLSADIFNLL